MDAFGDKLGSSLLQIAEHGVTDRPRVFTHVAYHGHQTKPPMP